MAQVASVKLTCWNKDVYEPSDDTFLLADVLKEYAPKWKHLQPKCIVELGSGSGYVITSIALLLKHHGLHAQLLAIDHNTAAAEATLETLAAHKVGSYADAVVSDLFQALLPSLGGKIDVLVFNPPYVPTPDEEVQGCGIESAWAGGYKGRRVIDRVLPQLPALLSPTGELFMVTVCENQPQGLIKEMEVLGFEGCILGERQADEEMLNIVHLRRK